MATVETIQAERGFATVQEIAKYTRTSRSSIYRAMDRRELKYCRLGGSRRLRWADVEAWIERNSIGGE